MEIDQNTIESFSQQSFIDTFKRLRIDTTVPTTNWIVEAQRILFNNIIDPELNNQDEIFLIINQIVKPDVYQKYYDKNKKINKLIFKLIKKSVTLVSSDYLSYIISLFFAFLFHYLSHPTNNEVQIQFNLKYEIDNTIISSENKTFQDKKYIKFLIKSLIFYAFSINKLIKFHSYKGEIVEDENLLSVFQKLEQLLFIQDKFYSIYLNKQFLKLIMFQGIFRNVNHEIVMSYFENLFLSNDSRLEIKDNILYKLFCNYQNNNFYYFFTIFFSVCQTDEENKQKIITKNISLFFNGLNESNFCIFGNYLSDKAKTLDFYLIDLVTHFNILNSINPEIVLKSYNKNDIIGKVDDLFNLFFFFCIFFGKYMEIVNIEKSEKLLYSNILEKGKENKKISVHEIIIEKFKLSSIHQIYENPDDQIKNLSNLEREFDKINDLETNILIISLLKQIMKYNILYLGESNLKQIQDEIRRIAININNKTLLLMCKTQKFHLGYLNLILESVNDLCLEYPINNINFFFSNSQISTINYIMIFYQYQIFYINYCIIKEENFEIFQNTMIKGFTAFGDKIFDFLHQNNFHKIKIMYLYLHLKLFEMMLLTKTKIQIILPYCMFCLHKIKNENFLFYSQFMIYCPNCSKFSMVVNFKENNYFSKNSLIIRKEISKFENIFQNFIKKNIIPSINNCYITHKLFLEFSIFFSKCYKKKKKLFDIGEEIMHFYSIYQNSNFDMENIKILTSPPYNYDFYTILKIYKWKNAIIDLYIS